jgi:ribosomal protein S18 acetylase RimI-like enzyme
LNKKTLIVFLFKRQIKVNNRLFKIKTAGIEDISLIRDMTHAIWPETYIPIIGEEQVRYMIDLFYSPLALREQMLLLQHQFIICYDENAPAGFASYSEIEPRTYKLHKLYVMLNVQGKGAGYHMLSHILDELRDRNAKALCLNVNRHNKSAIHFYERNGFQVLKDEDIDIGDGYFMNDHVLSLPVSKPSE